MAEVALSTEDMLLVMELAGWKYHAEKKREWGAISRGSDVLHIKYGASDESQVGHVREDALNIRDAFSLFLEHRETGHG